MEHIRKMSYKSDEEPNDIQIIETGDSVKVKQVLDDAIMGAIQDMGYAINYRSDNLKLLFMFLSCIAAMIAQFYPVPFPENRMALGLCCGSYFVMSCALQYIVSFIDQDTIAITHSFDDNEDTVNKLKFRTDFPRFQDVYTFTVEELEKKDATTVNSTIGEMHVGKYFTEAGEFDEVGFVLDVNKVVKKFQDRRYKTYVYGHKADKSD